mmetsp:Transcript_32006/g.53975  ORF Transcript_32006/g.53975 Transcript_32006/m.53975 type:complete len:151 (-) Transcript_32006:83-535(-)
MLSWKRIIAAFAAVISVVAGFRAVPVGATGLLRLAGNGGIQGMQLNGAVHKVTIQNEGKETVIEIPEDTSVLEAALEAGFELPHDCKLGVCLTCPAKVISGTVDQSGTTLDDSVVEQGYALTCMTFPRSDIVIAAIDEDELLNAQFSGRD